MKQATVTALEPVADLEPGVITLTDGATGDPVRVRAVTVSAWGPSRSPQGDPRGGWVTTFAGQRHRVREGLAELDRLLRLGV
jgi:hypothetical protein